MFNPGMANMQGMMKKVQKMQQDMLKMQEELKNRTVEATAGGGAVTVVVTGRKTVEKVLLPQAQLTPKMWKCWKIWLLLPLTKQCAK